MTTFLHPRLAYATALHIDCIATQVCGFYNGKSGPMVDIHLPSIVDHFLESSFWFCPNGFMWEFLEVDHRKGYSDAEKCKKLATTNTWTLADQLPTFAAQVIVPTSIFAHLQNKNSGAV